MSPQLLWTIAGLILTVLTLGAVALSSTQSSESATAKLIASEVGNVSVAGKLWVANKSVDGSYTNISADLIQPFIADLNVTGSGGASYLNSKAFAAASIAISSPAPDSYRVTIIGLSASQTPLVKEALTGKACTVADGTPAATSLIYTCKG